jgi:PPOX class probable F420-dependent enzyme
MARAERGVLATRHPHRGVDAVPVCFAVADRTVVVPVDRVKPKVSTDLQRVKNLVADRRAALLCDHWDGGDWTRLWWVRASLTRTDATDGERSTLASLLRAKYPPYHHAAFADLIVFRLEAITGWSARGPTVGDPADRPDPAGPAASP